MKWRFACFAILATLVAGCGTPQAVRELSAETGAAVLTMAADAQQVAAAAQKQAQGRLAALDEFSREIIRGRLEHETQLAAARKAGDPIVRTYDDVKSFASEQDALAQKLEADRAASQDEAVKSQAALSAPMAQYKSVGDDLATLAKKKDRWARVKATGAWVADVADRVNDAKKQAADAANGKTAGK